MDRNRVLNGVKVEREGGLQRAISRASATLVAMVLLIVAGAQSADAQSALAPVTVTTAPANTATITPAPDSALPSLADITGMLRSQFRVTPAESQKIARAVLTEADRLAISPVLLLAVMAVESSFDRHAVSVAGARGLMQVLPAAHPQLIAGTTDLSDPAINVRIGSTILRDYLDASGGDLDAALLRYSGGGRGYARRVVAHMQRFDASLRRE